MEQLSQSPFFPVPVRWFELPVPTVRSGLGQLAQSTQAGDTAAAATGTEAPAVSPSATPVAEASADEVNSSVGVLLNELA